MNSVEAMQKVILEQLFDLESTGKRALRDAFALALAMKALKNIPVISEEDVAETALTK